MCVIFVVVLCKRIVNYYVQLRENLDIGLSNVCKLVKALENLSLGQVSSIESLGCGSMLHLKLTETPRHFGLKLNAQTFHT